ncbi:unnamed protein product [Candidula unifasciata]|uniref:Uncharacterized protein n=1 Tax=Candidula unifasciata TaxID=100452 RepID=A0A8S3YNW3_9EUPU|nr:unnamed protein product [Candidula unifasciata]
MLAWEKLMASTERERNNLRLLKAGWPDNGMVQPASQAIDKNSDGESEKSSVLSESDRSDMMSIVSDKMSVENCEEADCTDRLLPNGDLPATVGDMLNYVIEPSLIANANLLGDIDNLDKLLESNPSLEQLSSTDIYVRPAVIFPCIIEALSWACQGRDPKVQVQDPQAIPQTIPSFLSEADHIQVLATGSLNFVGGVLDVLSSADDVYSN